MNNNEKRNIKEWYSLYNSLKLDIYSIKKDIENSEDISRILAFHSNMLLELKDLVDFLHKESENSKILTYLLSNAEVNNNDN